MATIKERIVMSKADLMTDDWVKTPEGNYRVLGVLNDVVYTDFCNDERNGMAFSDDMVEPISLTPEALERNGFKPYIPEYHLETVYACQDVSKAVADELYALWPYQDGSFYLLLRVNGKDMVRMDINYIHQLQHALRLCGIEKEIIL